MSGDESEGADAGESLGEFGGRGDDDDEGASLVMFDLRPEFLE